MRRVVCLIVAIVVIGAAVPAYAVDVTPYEAAESMAVYGYTDESVSVSSLASQLGVSPRVAAGTAMLIDSWAVGNYGSRLTASQLGNLAQAAQTYMTDSASWDDWTDYLAGGVEVAGGYLFDLRPWYDALGFATLAEHEAIPDVPAATFGTTYPLVSGVRTRAALPVSYAGSYWDSAGTYTREALMSVAGDVGGRWKVVQGGNYGDYYYSDGGKERIYCGKCGWNIATGGSYSWILYAATGSIMFPMFSGLEAALSGHVATCALESEAAVVIDSLSTAGGLGHVLLAAATLANPGATVLGAADAWGVPGVLPPSAIHDGLEFADSWGDDLSAVADDLASDVASLTADGASLVERGLGGVLSGISELVRWVGGLGDWLESFVRYLFTPNPDWIRIEVRDRFSEFSDELEQGFPFAYIAEVRGIIAVFEGAE